MLFAIEDSGACLVNKCPIKGMTMKKMIKKVAVLSVFAVSAFAVTAGCIDKLDACYKKGGSETKCNTVYTNCLLDA